MSSRPLANPSGALAVGTTNLVSGKFTLNSVTLIPDGTNACSVQITDGPAGKLMAQLAIGATSTIPVTVDYSNALKAEVGITVIVAGGTATALVNTGGA
jgi:hypothetical protein